MPSQVSTESEERRQAARPKAHRAPVERDDLVEMRMPVEQPAQAAIHNPREVCLWPQRAPLHESTGSAWTTSPSELGLMRQTRSGRSVARSAIGLGMVEALPSRPPSWGGMVAGVPFSGNRRSMPRAQSHPQWSPSPSPAHSPRSALGLSVARRRFVRPRPRRQSPSVSGLRVPRLLTKWRKSGRLPGTP